MRQAQTMKQIRFKYNNIVFPYEDFYDYNEERNLYIAVESAVENLNLWDWLKTADLRKPTEEIDQNILESIREYKPNVVDLSTDNYRDYEIVLVLIDLQSIEKYGFKNFAIRKIKENLKHVEIQRSLLVNQLMVLDKAEKEYLSSEKSSNSEGGCVIQ